MTQRSPRLTLVGASLALRNNTTLSSIDLGYNHIGDAGAKDLANALRNNTTLSSIDLSGNRIGDASAKDLANALRNNKTLSSIDLGVNRIGDAGAKNLANALRNNTTLSSIVLRWNLIGAAGAKNLANALLNNATLSSIDLGKNGIGRKILDLIEKRLARNRERANQRDAPPYAWFLIARNRERANQPVPLTYTNRAPRQADLKTPVEEVIEIKAQDDTASKTGRSARHAAAIPAIPTTTSDTSQTTTTPSASSLFETNFSSSESTISLPKLQAHLEALEQTQKTLQQQLKPHQQTAEEAQNLKARLAQTQIDQADARYRIDALEAEQADARAAKIEIAQIKTNPTHNAFYAMVKEHFRCWSHSVEAAEGKFVDKATPNSTWFKRIQKAQQALPKWQQLMQSAPSKVPASTHKTIQKIADSFLAHAPGALQQAGKALPVAGLALQTLGALLQTYNKREQTRCIQRSLCFLGTLTYPELFFEQLARRLTLAQIATLDDLSDTPPPVKDNNIKQKIEATIQWLNKKLGKVPLTPAQQLAQSQSLQLLTYIFGGTLAYDPQHSQEQLLDICLHTLGVNQALAPAAISASPSAQASGNVSLPLPSATPVMAASQSGLSPTVAILHTPATANQPNIDDVTQLKQAFVQQQEALVQLNSRLAILSKHVTSTSPREGDTKGVELAVGDQVVVKASKKISEQTPNRTEQANAASHHPQLESTITLLINRVLTLEEALRSAGHHIPQETPPVRTLPDDLRSPEAERAVAVMLSPHSQRSLESTDDDLTPGANLPIQKKSAAQVGQQVAAQIITPYQQQHLLIDNQSLPAKTFRFLFKRAGQERLQELQNLSRKMQAPSKADSDAPLREQLIQLLWQILQSSSKKMKPLVMDCLVELCNLVVEGLNEKQQIREIESALTQAGLLSNPFA